MHELDDLIDRLMANPEVTKKIDEALAVDPDDPAAVAAWEKKNPPHAHWCGNA